MNTEYFQYLEQFLEAMIVELGSAKASISAYKRDLMDFAAYLKSVDVRDIDVSTHEIEYFIASLSKNNISPRTIARKLSTIRQYYKFMISESVINHNPTLLVSSPSFAMKIPEFLTVDQVRNLLKAVDHAVLVRGTPESVRLKSMISMLYCSGMRVSELISIKMSNLNLNQNGLFGGLSGDQNHFVISGKGKRERVVFLNSSAISSLNDYLKMRQYFISHADSKSAMYLFASKSSQGHMTRQNFALLLKQVAIDAGIDPEHISPHVLRHTFASMLINNGADIRIIQEMLGHADISSTQIYTHLDKNAIKYALENQHPVISMVS
jgi:integrase/recombinase XerD